MDSFDLEDFYADKLIKICGDIESDPVVIAKELRYTDDWDLEMGKRLCRLAGIEDEFNNTSGDALIDIVERAADILGVYVF